MIKKVQLIEEVNINAPEANLFKSKEVNTMKQEKVQHVVTPLKGWAVKGAGNSEGKKSLEYAGKND